MKYRPFLSREYDVLPRFLQFIIFINQGVYRGGSPWFSFKWFIIKRKIQRIHCWNNNHKWNKRDWLDKDSKLIPYVVCNICGEQFKL